MTKQQDGMNASCTAVLLHYKRPKNLEKIISSLKTQSIQPSIFLCDNSPGPEPCAFLREVDRVVRIPWNANTFVRIHLSFWVETPWILFLDDDLMPADKEFLADALRIAEARPEGITGAFGRRLSASPPHYLEDALGAVEAVKGRFMLFRKELLSKVHLLRWPLHSDAQYRIRCDDLYLSLEVGAGKPVHWADAGLQGRLTNLTEGAESLSWHPDHLAIREAFVRRYMETVLGNPPC